MAEHMDDPTDSFSAMIAEDHFMRHLRRHDPNIDKSFVGQAIVRGMDIVVEWDGGYEDYVLYLPQIDTGYAREEGFSVPDQLIRIGSRAKDAAAIFEDTVAAAEEISGVYSLFEEMGRRIHGWSPPGE